MKELIVYLTIFSLLFTSCATMHTIKPNKNSTKLFSLIEESAKDRKTTVELVNGKYFLTQNLKFNDDFLTFFETDSLKTERIELSEIHRIVIEKKDIKTGSIFKNWLYSGIALSAMLTLGAKASTSGGDDSDFKIVPPNSHFILMFLSGVAISATCGLIHVIAKQSGNNTIYYFSAKSIK